jgi:hypothetical protein
LQAYEDTALKKAEVAEKTFHIDNLEDFMHEVKDLTKSELIQLLREARYQADEFALWLLRKNRSKSEISEKIDLINLETKHNKEKRAQARKEQAKKKVSEMVESQALGIDDVFDLIEEAIKILESWPDSVRNQYTTEIARIRKIMVDLLCESNRSRHNYSHEEWAGIILRTIKTTHVYTAKRRLNSSQTKPT